MNHENSASPTVASFFSGIGGFDLGFEQAGFNVTLQCEINPFCNDILEQHWPDVPRFKDIGALDAAVIPTSDVWVGGFPCQDVSVARMGPRDGLRGKRSGLFFKFAHLIGSDYPELLSLRTSQAYSLPMEGEISKSLFERWPASGMAWDGGCLTVDTSESPNHASESILLDVIQTGEVPQRYFLSQNAAVGMLRRAKKMGRALFPPLRQALEILSQDQSSRELPTASTPAPLDILELIGAEPMSLTPEDEYED